MNLNFADLYQIDSEASKKKIYRFNKTQINKLVIDFSYYPIDFKLFIEVNNYLSNINISIPTIFEINKEKHIIIMEDFGDKRYDKLISITDPRDILYNAVDSLIEIQNNSNLDTFTNFEKYNFDLFKEEISEFVNFYLPLKNYKINYEDEFYSIWESEFNNIDFNWDTFVHKDFEFTNLIHLPDRKGHLKCGIIDFQNAFIGFSGWDLFSLLENPRIYFNQKYNIELVEYFYRNTNQKISLKEFLVQYYFLNIARQTRIIGRWINLDSKNKNNNYLKFLNVTIKRLRNSLLHLNNRKITNLYEKILIE
tara:strand:- start:627 stop:1550 length:924 start_codon:yes stop_codon:yes gene_type:complete